MSEHETASERSPNVPAEAAGGKHAGAGEHGAGEQPAASVPPPLFDREELAEFDSDDSQAGGAIGKMLALFFFYTVIAMSLVAWWTFRAVGE